MDAIGVNAFRVLKLGHAHLISKLLGFGSFPQPFRLIMQLKDLTLDMALKVQYAMLDQAQRKRPLESCSSSSPPTWQKTKKSV